MARYFFHTADGQCYPDDTGIELSDWRAVRAAALKTMADMSNALCEDLFESGALRVTVNDDQGLTLMVLDLMVTMAPASAAVSGRQLSAPP